MGITGGVGSGKSRVLEILKEEYGFRVIQADQVAKDLMQQGRRATGLWWTSWGRPY